MSGLPLGPKIWNIKPSSPRRAQEDGSSSLTIQPLVMKWWEEYSSIVVRNVCTCKYGCLSKGPGFFFNEKVFDFYHMCMNQEMGNHDQPVFSCLKGGYVGENPLTHKFKIHNLVGRRGSSATEGLKIPTFARRPHYIWYSYQLCP